ncbi:MAG: hypothetical protein HOM39_01665 [Planctomycetes bacterium]|nr:hypothetical protein [Planctomycetota bacterium]
MEVHDVGPFRIFQKGMVVTIELGINILEEGLGICIEDRAVVTAEGCRVLPATIPKDLENLESGGKRGVTEGAARWHRSLAPLDGIARWHRRSRCEDLIGSVKWRALFQR